MRRGFRIYVAVLAAVLAVVLVVLDWGYVIDLEPRHMAGLGALLLLAIFSEYASIPLKVGGLQGSYSIIFVLLYAGVFFLGPAGTTLVALLANGFSEFVIRRKDFGRASFNAIQHGLSMAGGGLVFVALGGVPSTTSFEPNVLAFVGFAMTASALNLGFAAVGIALHEDLRVVNVASRLAGKWGAGLLYDVFVMPLAIVIGWAYSEYWIWGLAAIILPVLLVRGAYFTNFQLQQANRNLLKALVKAIETRDPYTSGHSMRVASLAARVAGALNLPATKVDNIETAALLHDVGKIEAIYTDILQKQGGLTDEEMEIIKSHVDKGVELLTSLSSFHPDVISAVKHHHERYDGSGYPEGLGQTVIPLGARIIKICDAVDAMLSDRPYRKALALQDVREQLMLFAEREFDPALVSLFFREELLEEHSAAIRTGELPSAPMVARSGGDERRRVPARMAVRR